MNLSAYVGDTNTELDVFGLAKGGKIKDEYLSMDEYWKAKHAPTQVTPGITKITEVKPSSRANESYRRVSHYDEYGRLIAQTHYTSHGEPDIHPNPHHHRYDPATGGAIRNPEDGSKIFAGEYDSKLCR